MPELIYRPDLSFEQTAELLDERIVTTIAAYSIMDKLLSDSELAPEDNDYLKLSDDLLLELVLYSDARSQMTEESDDRIDYYGWIEEARKGMERAKKQGMPCIFSKRSRMLGSPLPPHEHLYNAMHARRGAVRGPVLNRWIGEEYAQRVALGQIAIMPETDFGE